MMMATLVPVSDKLLSEKLHEHELLSAQRWHQELTETTAVTNNSYNHDDDDDHDDDSDGGSDDNNTIKRESVRG